MSIAQNCKAAPLGVEQKLGLRRWKLYNRPARSIQKTITIQVATLDKFAAAPVQRITILTTFKNKLQRKEKKNKETRLLAQE